MADSTTMQKKRGRPPRVSLVMHRDANDTHIPFEPGLFQDKLLAWYDANARELPWRAKPGQAADPYGVWLSEIMLQQTTVKAVIPYYLKFLGLWPTVADLAAAPRDEILAAWAGLGYYSRARNLHACAQALAERGFPDTAAGLQELPGIGPYTAAAIASIAFGEPAGVLDGNVERVLSRVFAVETPLPAAKQRLRGLAQALTPMLRAGDYAQAMMDLGATVCTPRSPSCILCPVQTLCQACARLAQESFPRKLAKAARPQRACTAYVLMAQIEDGPRVLLRTRQDKGLLGGMLEAPSTSWTTKPDAEEIAPFADNLFSGVDWLEAGVVPHTFTHFHLDAHVLAGECAFCEDAAKAVGGQWVAVCDFGASALPSLMRKIVAAGLRTLGVNEN